MNVRVRKWIKRTALIVLIPVTLLLMSVVLVYTPFFQRFAVNKATQFVSGTLGLDVHFGEFRLKYPLNLAARNISVTDSLGDTIAEIKSLQINIKLAPLLRKEVSIGRFSLDEADIHLQSMIKGMAIDAVIGSIEGHSERISIPHEEAKLNMLKLSNSNITIRIDSFPTQADTTKTAVNWKIIFDDIQVDNLAFALSMPTDSIMLGTTFENISLTDGDIKLDEARYYLSQISLSGANIQFDKGLQPPKNGIDPSHINISKIYACVDSILYQPEGIQAFIHSIAADERSGLTVTAMTCRLQMNEESILVPDFVVKTPYSSVSAQLVLPAKTPQQNPSGALRAQLSAAVAQRDVMTVLGDAAKTIAALPPDNIFTLSCLLDGNWNSLNIKEFKSAYPGMFQAEATGVIKQVTDSIARSGSFDVTAVIQGNKLLPGLIPPQYAGRFSLPDTVRITMQAALQEGAYSAEVLMSELQGQMSLSGKFNPKTEEYLVDIKADDIAPIHFLPQDSIMLFTGSFQASGRGLDVFGDSTGTQFSGVVNDVNYKNMTLTDISFDGSLKDHAMKGEVTSNYPYIKGKMTVDGVLQKDKLSGMLVVSMDSLDLQGLKVTENQFSNAFEIFSQFDSDLKKHHQLDVTLGNWNMSVNNRIFTPKSLILRSKTTEDTTQVSLHAGDLGIIFTAGADAVSIADKLKILASDIAGQIKRDSMIDFQELQPLYMPMNLRVEAMKDNPVYNYLQNRNIYFDSFYINAGTSPQEGLKMDGLLLSLIKDTMKIDTVRLDVRQTDSTEIKYTFDVIKNRFRMQEAYTLGLRGSLKYGQGDMELNYRNGQGKTGFLVGLRAAKQPDGINIQVFPSNPILAFQQFIVDDNNYIKFKSLRDISADLRMTNRDNASLWVHSLENNGVMEELLAEINGIDLNGLSTNFLQIPSMQGKANMSLRYVPEGNTFMVVGGANINNLVYQGETVGDLLLNSVYLPMGKNEHQLDINLFHSDKEIATLTALYQPLKNERIDGSLEVHSMGLSTLNPFLAGMARLNGALQSKMTVSGSAKQPLLNGYMKLDTASVYSADVGSRFRFDDKQVEISDNTIKIDGYKIFAVGNNPLTIDGKIDLNMNNPAKSMADIRMAASNMQVLDAVKTPESLVYGKLYATLTNFTAKGPVNALVVRGSLNLPANTNLTYIMKESPLTVQDRMANLVTFSYFRDTIPRRRSLLGERTQRSSQAIGGLDLQMSIRVNSAAKLKIELDSEGTNHIDLNGGGDLSYRYTPQGDMMLTGRYTLTGGLIRYDMPVISNKTLTINGNSYIEWNGDPFDPYMSIKATERIRASVGTEDGQSSRLVNFDAGIDVKQRMENLSLMFTLDAVDDASLQTQLTALGAEERSKRAVGLLLTGIYLDEDKSGKVKFDMGTAMTSFLQTEINQLTGDLLKGVDFNFGMENYEQEGVSATNYSFRFSKRFYNDRINVMLGGNVTSGHLPNDNNTFINDASIEYRLDTQGNRYARLFYQRQYESLLEGEITKYGGGVVFRRKMRRLADLFFFRRRVITQEGR
jgi:hypothetical protein